MAITKKMRFEIFKRDSFTCQYCGRTAPDVVLNVDHIQPGSKGGTEDLLNLLTACLDCNQGKRATPLSDHAAVTKRKKQLNELQQRREQLEMLLEWHKGLLNVENDVLNGAIDVWQDYAPGWTINDNGTRTLQKWLRKFSLKELLEAMAAAAEQYLEYEQTDNGNTKVTQQSWEKGFSFIPRICTCNRRCKDKPYLRDLYYARGILRKRLSYLNDWQAMQLMEAAIERGAAPEEIISLCKSITSWTQFNDSVSQCGSK